MALWSLRDLLQDGAAGMLGAGFGFGGFLLSRAATVLAAVGVIVVLARGRERVGPFDLRGVQPPPREVWLASLAACMVAAALSQVNSLSWLGELVVDPGTDIARDLTRASSARPVVGALVASAYWGLAVTGALAVRVLLARRDPKTTRAF